MGNIISYGSKIIRSLPGESFNVLRVIAIPEI
jgi:hypothetical protein